MQHIIEWPGGEWLTRKEALRALGIKAALFDRLIALGIVPPPEGDTPRTLVWKWSDIYAAAQLWPRLLKLIAPEPPPPVKARGGKPTPDLSPGTPD